jgi:hypothetical protein
LSVVEVEGLSAELKKSASGTQAEEHFYVHPVLRGPCSRKFWVLGSGQVRRSPVSKLGGLGGKLEHLRVAHKQKNIFHVHPVLRGPCSRKFWVWGFRTGPAQSVIEFEGSRWKGRAPERGTQAEEYYHLRPPGLEESLILVILGFGVWAGRAESVVEVGGLSGELEHPRLAH